MVPQHTGVTSGKCCSERDISSLELSFVFCFIDDVTDDSYKSLPFPFYGSTFNHLVHLADSTIDYRTDKVTFTDLNGGHEGKWTTPVNGMEMRLTSNTGRDIFGVWTRQISEDARGRKQDRLSHQSEQGLVSPKCQ